MEKVKRIAKLAVVMIVFNVGSAFGQTRTEIEAKLGQPVNAYQVSERIWMSPQYGSDGQVCRMTFYPRRFSSSATYFINELPFDEFRSVIDAIVPVAIRGSQKEPFGNGMWTIGGRIRWANFIYERVTISYVAAFRYNPTLGMGEPVNLDDEVSKEKEKPKTTKKDLFDYRESTAEIQVQWSDRKCTDR